MKKLLIPFIILIAVISVFCFLYVRQNGGSITDVTSNHTDFAIKDTSIIDQIRITEANGGSIIIQRRNQSKKWKLNEGQFDARNDAISLILETVYRIKVKQEVDLKAQKNIITQIAGRNKKVEFFNYGKAEPFKTYYVGNSTPDKLGTFMVMVKNENGNINKSVPCIMYKPGMYGHLESRFFSDLNEWRSTAVFRYGRGDISKIHFQFYENPKNSHVIEIDQSGNLQLFNNEGIEINDFNKTATQRYVTLLMNLNYEGFNRELDIHAADSILKSTPLYSLTITNSDNEEKKVIIHNKFAPPGITDYKGDEIKWDKDRCWGFIDGSSELMKLQFFSWGPVFKPISFFQEK